MGKGQVPEQLFDPNLVKSNFKRTSHDNTPLSAAATLDDQSSETVNSGAMVVAHGSPTGIPPLPPVYVSPRKDNKRPRKVQAGKEKGDKIQVQETTDALSAGSSEEYRRAQ